MFDDVTLADVRQARERIQSYIKRTPLETNQTLSQRLKTNVSLKLEVFQKTGSFKVRGAFNKALSLTEEERRHGLVAVSGGNHAQAVAYVARTLGVRALILMPETTPRNYIDGTKEYGAEVLLVRSAAEAFEKAPAYQNEGWVFIHPFDDPLVMAGQGTVGLEILEDAPDVTDLVISIGGGGFIGGIAVAVKSLKPEVRIWGVETVGADAMSQALAAGKIIQLPAITSIAKTLGAPAASERTLALARKYLESVTVVPDSEAVAALKFLLERTKVLTEPAASCTLAAAERLKFSPADQVVLVMCGGNIGVADLCGF